MTGMRAVGYQQTGDIERPASLVDIDLPTPSITGRDILVQVKAVSVNPVDTKVRQSAAMGLPASGTWKVLGWDASGVVASTGAQVTLFRAGDEVFYAGAIGRQGTNAEYHLVDERLVGFKPRTLNWGAAAALPLTALAAWETLFDRIDVNKPVAGAAPVILIIGGAGGVGSIAIQLARALTDLKIIATASRPETRAWVREMGAHYIIDHTLPLDEQISALQLGAPVFVFSTTQTAKHLKEIARLIAPQGRLALIDDPEALNITKLKLKSVSIHWELMFTRGIYETSDMGEQGRILNEVSRLIDEGTLRSTMTQRLSPINAANLKQAHALIESGKALGKIVLEGF